MNKKYFCISIVLILLVFLIIPQDFEAKAQTNSQTYSIILDMFKWDFYFQAIEKLEASSEELKYDFNYWLYKGLAYERTQQLTKALEAYKQAYTINPDATNIPNKLRNLKLQVEKNTLNNKTFEFNKEKSLFLMNKAKELKRQNDYDKAYRYFLQAVDYDNTLLQCDDGFISAGEQYYRQQSRQKKDFAMLFLGIFQFLQGDLDRAKKNLISYKILDSRSQALDNLAKLYTQRLNEIINQQISARKALRLRVQLEQERIDMARKEAERRNKGYSKLPHSDRSDPVSSSLKAGPNTITAKPSGFSERYNERRAMLAFNQISNVEANSEEEAILIRKLGKAGHHSNEIMKFLISRLDPTNDYYAVVVLDAIEDIGAPSALMAINPLIRMIQNAPYPEDGFRQLALFRISRMRLAPEKVIPLIIDEYKNSTTNSQKKFMGDCAVRFGSDGLPTLYYILEDSWRSNKRPVAELVNRITGESINELMKR